MFPQTRWSLVLRSPPTGSPEAQEALDKLCRAYWYPLYVYVRRTGRRPEDAEDLVQGYLGRLLARGYLKSADPTRGRFRSFLLKDLKFFLANEWEKESAEKRGHGMVTSLEAATNDAESRFLVEPAASGQTPDQLFEQSFTLLLIQQTLDALRPAVADPTARSRFDVLGQLLAGKNPQMSQKRAADLLGISEEAVGKAVFDLRKRFAQAFREIVSQTVASYEELDEEVQYHMNVFTR